MTIVRIKVDFSDVGLQDRIWMIIDESFKRIYDVENKIRTERMLEGRNISLFLKEFHLPSDESVLVLHSNDLIKVRFSKHADDPVVNAKVKAPSPLLTASLSFQSSVCPSMAVSWTKENESSGQDSMQDLSSKREVVLVTESDVTNTEENPHLKVKAPSLATASFSLPSSVCPSMAVSWTKETEASKFDNMQDFNEREVTNTKENPLGSVSESIPAASSICVKSNFQLKREQETSQEVSLVSGGAVHCNVIPSGMEMEEDSDPVELDPDRNLVDLSEYKVDHENNTKETKQWESSWNKRNIDIEVNQVHRICRSKSLAKSLVSEKLKSDKNCPDTYVVDMKALEEAKKRRIAMIVQRLGMYGEFWVKDKKYEDGKVYYEGGTPDRMWLYPWTRSLEDLNDYIQVNLTGLVAKLFFDCFFL